jgi:hypothetical protein
MADPRPRVKITLPPDALEAIDELVAGDGRTRAGYARDAVIGDLARRGAYPAQPPRRRGATAAGGESA